MIFGDRPSLEWRDLFGDAQPVEIEIGCGKGAFLLATARAHPNLNFLGLEIQGRWVRHVEGRLVRASLANVRVLRADAAMVIRHFVRDASVAAYHVYFPDPWWKRKHAKRRLVTPDFARELHRTLIPGGVVWLATDVADRFTWTLEAFAAQPFAIERLDAREPGSAETNFETKYRREGRPLYYARAVKTV
jgi:tRNA (guanine-N7-)-methyltransferase